MACSCWNPNYESPNPSKVCSICERQTVWSAEPSSGNVKSENRDAEVPICQISRLLVDCHMLYVCTYVKIYGTVLLHNVTSSSFPMPHVSQTGMVPGFSFYRKIETMPLWFFISYFETPCHPYFLFQAHKFSFFFPSFFFSFFFFFSPFFPFSRFYSIFSHRTSPATHRRTSYLQTTQSWPLPTQLPSQWTTCTAITLGAG